MLVVVLPFALLVAFIERQRQIQIGASLLVIAFGIFLFVNPRHPRALARIRPTQLGFWSFAVAIAHGAGFMLVPISSHRKLLRAKTVVVSVAETPGQDFGRHGRERRAQANRCRSVESGLDDVRTGG